ncbi:MAG: sel1 repeat family protein [bacterium]|nr:sel1 repeat family protein [bacterium]
MNIRKIIIFILFTLLIASCSTYESTFKNLAENFYQDHKNDNTLLHLEKAANNGNISAMFKLGKIYYTGTRAVKKNSDKADYWYGRAANTGGYKTNCKIAGMYLKGKDTDKNYHKAIHYADMANFLYNPQEDDINKAVQIKTEAEKLIAESKSKTKQSTNRF